MENLFALNGKVALVSGASGGLGSEICKGLATFGADIVLTGRNRTKLKETSRQVKELGRSSLVVEADISDPDAVQRLVDSALSSFRSIDILVNAHGMNIRKSIETMNMEDWEQVINSNLRSVFLTCQAVGKVMMKRKSGKVVNISSVAAKIGYDKGYSAYAPSKAGVDALTRVLATEWGKYSINVNAIAPYFIRTSLTEKVLSDKEFSDWVMQCLPLKNLGTPEDVVGAVVFLCSKASNWITGQTIYIDGGRSVA